MRLLTFIVVFVIIPESLSARLPDLIPYRKGNLWGYSDSTKKILIEPQWYSVGFFTDGTARVFGEDGYGLIDISGKYLLEPRYPWIDEFVYHGLREVHLVEDEKHGMVNNKGEFVLPCEYVWFGWDGVFLQATTKNKSGVFDSTGRVVVPFNYTSFGDSPSAMGDSGIFALSKKRKWGVVDTSGKVIIPFKYYWVCQDGDYWHVYTSWGEGKYYTSRGQFIGDSVHIEYKPFPRSPTVVNGMQFFKGTNGLWGFEDEQYHLVIEPKYLSVNHFNSLGLADVWVRKGNCEYCYIHGYIDKHGTEYWEG